MAKLKMGYKEVLVFASLDVFTKKERGYPVVLSELGPDFKVRGRWDFLFWVLVTAKRTATCFLPLSSSTLL